MCYRSTCSARPWRKDTWSVLQFSGGPHAEVKVGRCMSDVRPVPYSVIHGSVLGSIIFSVVEDSMLRRMRLSSVAFADDFKIHCWRGSENQGGYTGWSWRYCSLVWWPRHAALHRYMSSSALGTRSATARVSYKGHHDQERSEHERPECNAIRWQWIRGPVPGDNCEG